MAGKTRMQQLEEMLAEDPHDPFLCYGLAMEFVGQGDDTEAARRFRELCEAHPDYVPSYQQAGQALARLGRAAEAREIWLRGVSAAQRAGNHHAAEEMEGFLAALE
jgi:predicted Zn-dependent protease